MENTINISRREVFPMLLGLGSLLIPLSTSLAKEVKRPDEGIYICSGVKLNGDWVSGVINRDKNVYGLNENITAVLNYCAPLGGYGRIEFVKLNGNEKRQVVGSFDNEISRLDGGNVQVYYSENTTRLGGEGEYIARFWYKEKNLFDDECRKHLGDIEFIVLGDLSKLSFPIPIGF
jgi:hypothetical protein